MAAPSVALRRTIPRFSGLAWKRARWGYVFIAPWIFGFLAFTAIPMVATFAFTFTNINLAQSEPLQFVGLKNYQTLLNDKQAWTSLGITFKFAALALPVAVFLPLLVALLLHSRHLRGSGGFRVLFFLPYVVPFVATVFIWGGMLNPETGWINLGLEAAGIRNPPGWLEDPTWVYPGLMLIGVWGIGAGIIVYLAALKGIPSDLYEAARIDGAGYWQQTRHITVPMLTPVIFYTLVLSVVEVLQYFLVPLVLQEGTGEPGGSTMFLNLYIYKNFFTFQNMSYGATLAWLLFLISLIITLVLFGTARRWVYYAGDAR
jgi:multiple sugar transport system permease protein